MFKTYRNLKSLHSLYEQNFVLINKLSGELDKHNKFSFQVGNLEIKSKVSISKKELSKFTDELKFQIKDATGIKDIVIKCRIYKEAKMMEVIEFQNFHKDLLSIFKLKKLINSSNSIFASLTYGFPTLIESLSFKSKTFSSVILSFSFAFNLSMS